MSRQIKGWLWDDAKREVSDDTPNKLFHPNYSHTDKLSMLYFENTENLSSCPSLQLLLNLHLHRGNSHIEEQCLKTEKQKQMQQHTNYLADNIKGVVT